MSSVRGRRRRGAEPLVPLDIDLSDLLEALNCAVVVRDAHGQFVYMNATAHEYFGSAEAINSGLDCINEDGTELSVEKTAKWALQTGERVQNSTIGVLSSDGTTRWVRAAAVPIRDDAGHVFATVGSAVDVTELKVAEQQLIQSENHFRALVENGFDVITICDADATVLYQSSTIEQQLGYKPEAKVGQAGFKYVHPDDLDGARQHFSEVLRRPGERIEFAFRVRHADGSWRWIEGFAHNRLDDPAVRGVVVNSRDGTERREAQRRERVADERWERLRAESTDAIISVDLSGRVQSWNAGAQRIFGWARDEVVGEILPWVPPDERADRLDLLQQALATGVHEIFEKDRIGKDGRRVPVLGTVAPLMTTGDLDCQTQFIVILTDMSVHVRAEEQAKILALLEERERIAMDLHDGVIQSLYAISLTLEANARGNQEQLKSLAKRATGQINNIIQDIRNFIFDLRPERAAEGGLEEGLQFLVDQLKANSLIRVELHIDAGVSPRLRPAVTNELLQIVREATSNVIRHARATVVELTLSHTESLLTISIKDNGRGFDPTAADVTVGDGITNMRVRARAIGGSADLMSSEGKGTLVRIEVPISGVRDVAVEHRSIRLLVVDDHEVVRLGLTGAFQNAPGVAVVGEACSVEEAVDAARELQPDVVLMDVRLPDGSGIDACRLIRSECTRTKVVMLTSFSDEEAALASILAGASGYMLKHNDSEQLIAAIEKVAAGESLLDAAAVQAAIQLIRHTGGKRESDPLAALSEQEGKVLRLITDGKTNREIARTLSLSEHTVRTYASNIFSKLHVTRRAEAAAIAARRAVDPASAF